MSATLDFHRSVFKLWEDQGLDEVFKSFWDESKREDFLSCLDEEASPSQPFPYCVIEFGKPATNGRSTGPACANDELREYREIALTFNVHAKQQGNTSAKIAAGELASRLLKVYGGDPDESPKSMSIVTGNVLLCQYVSDYPIKTGDQECQWVIDYSVLLDVRMKT